ncbi:type VII secretion protein EccCa [Nocardia sp. NPDC058666]|uniref:type VII secretion protein EccCa n=1 Tax=unclassified Nocardia TaxID=2637762 RepID=UPI003662D2D2
MVTEGFVRRTRIAPPRAPGGETALNAPPEIPRAVPAPLLSKLMPVVMIVALIGMLFIFARMGRSMLSNPMMLMFPMMMVMSMAGMMMGQRGGSGKSAAELNEERKDYFRYLDQTRREVRRTGAKQLEALVWSHPAPDELPSIIGSLRMWERRPNDPDFGHVRVGIGTHRLATKLARPETGPVEDLEPVSTVALRRFVRSHSVVHHLPTAISLRAFPAINIEGSAESTHMLVRGMLMELCAFHGPDHVAVAIICADPDSEEWSWAKWLPHLQHRTEVDGMGMARMMYGSLGELETTLADDLLERGRFMRNAPPTKDRLHLVVVIDDGYVNGSERLVSESGLDSVTVIDLAASASGLGARRGLQLVASEGEVLAKSANGAEKFATADQVSIAEAAAFARGLGRYRLATAAQIVSLGDSSSTTADPGLMALLKIPDAAQIEASRVWRPRVKRERLRVPIGVTPDGSPVDIDIKESAEHGMGPHGLCIGATGSGKSEFLRTLVLSMVTTHSPDQLNLVLVDFKGGATFLGLDPLPHVSAVITNLEEELSLVDRMRDALAGELNRRQELLREAGNFVNVTAYEEARAAGVALDPLPALFIVVDEFSELLAQKPDFADLFVMIGRLGRSLAVHLLLASQRLEENKLRGLDTHLSYRIGLRTFSANESRAVLGITDAYHLPGVPGAGYLKSDASDPLRFNASYVSGPYVAPRATRQADGRAVIETPPRLFTAAPVEVLTAPEPEVRADPLDLLPPPPPVGEEGVPDSLLQVVVKRLTGHGRPAHEVWLPPLVESPTVDMLLPDPAWQSPVNRHGQLWMPIGIIDKPYEQRRDVMTIDLSGAQGHVAVVGGPQSGKSTTLRTIIMSAAATHTPEQVQFYCLDFGGGSMAGLNGLPHVGSIARGTDVDRVRRTVAELSTLLRQREEQFAQLGIESMADYRRRKVAAQAQGRTDDPILADQFGDAFLVIDNWMVIRDDYDDLVAPIAVIAQQGLSRGIHLILGANAWREIRANIKDQIGTRIELRLGDPGDSELGRRVAVNVPVNRPGRGLTPDQLHMLIALPRMDSDTNPENLSEGVATSREQMAALYGERRAPGVRMLPESLPREQVLREASARGIVQGPTRVVVGINEADLQPVVLDFGAEPHFMAFSDVECGKTTLLRTIIRGITDNSTSETARVILIDYRRTLLGTIEGDQLAGYSTSSQTCGPMLKEVAEFLAKRIPGSDITPRQLRERNWWSGPEIYIVVDDYDMVTTGGFTDPLAPLLELLPQARDIGLHLVITRQMGGVSRALYAGLLGSLKNLSVSTLVMSGSKDEGKLVGDVRPMTLPPGRGVLWSRAGQKMVQIIDLPPED